MHRPAGRRPHRGAQLDAARRRRSGSCPTPTACTSSTPRPACRLPERLSVDARGPRRSGARHRACTSVGASAGAPEPAVGGLPVLRRRARGARAVRRALVPQPLAGDGRRPVRGRAVHARPRRHASASLGVDGARKVDRPVGRAHRCARRPRRRRVRAGVREPRCRGRRHHRPPARPDLRLRPRAQSPRRLGAARRPVGDPMPTSGRARWSSIDGGGGRGCRSRPTFPVALEVAPLERIARPAVAGDEDRDELGGAARSTCSVGSTGCTDSRCRT